MNTVFEIIENLSYGKKDVGKDPDVLKNYAPFVVNRAFSMGEDTIMYANEVNKFHFATKQMQHDYYFHSLRKRKRYNKWAKASNVEYIDEVCEYFNVNKQKAMSIIARLSMKQLEEIRDTFDVGGRE